MHYHLITLFPEWFTSPLNTALFAKANKAGIVSVDYINPRDFTENKHKKVDDSPYGGGPGMVLMAQPILDAVKSIEKAGKQTGSIIILTPTGEPLTQKIAHELAQEENLTLICGRYEGFDERIYDLLPIRRISVGEAILNGGEVAALAVIEATARLQVGYMGKEESGEDESYSNNLLEYPHYTRPDNFMGLEIPKELQNGNHSEINTWRRKSSLQMTLKHRPDLLNNAQLSEQDRVFLNQIKNTNLGKNIHIALVHYPILLKNNTVGSSSVTNLDLHDIARISCTYDVSSLQIVSPIQDQKLLVQELLDHWVHGEGAKTNPDRSQALKRIHLADSLEQAKENITAISGKEPLLIGTSAKAERDKKGREKRLATPFQEIKNLAKNNTLLIVLGTSHGLAPEALAKCDYILPPLRYLGTYNHLPVRAACAIILDRLLGDLD